MKQMLEIKYNRNQKIHDDVLIVAAAAVARQSHLE